MEKENKKSVSRPDPAAGENENGKGIINRRHFLEIAGTGALAIASIGAVALTGQFLSPNVLLEPSKRFKAGKIDNFALDSVTLNKEQKVYIVRGKEGYFYAVSAVCTHLGCITNWKTELGIIACPCHGSKFTKEGKVIEGPAPKPLPRFAMALDEQGQLIVDKNVTVSEDMILKI
jgi:cytochrome b6-f complex iron-sulfur subunit